MTGTALEVAGQAECALIVSLPEELNGINVISGVMYVVAGRAFHVVVPEEALDVLGADYVRGHRGEAGITGLGC
jgi:hypothetical protein